MVGRSGGIVNCRQAGVSRAPCRTAGCRFPCVEQWWVRPSSGRVRRACPKTSDDQLDCEALVGRGLRLVPVGCPELEINRRNGRGDDEGAGKMGRVEGSEPVPKEELLGASIDLLGELDESVLVAPVGLEEAPEARPVGRPERTVARLACQGGGHLDGCQTRQQQRVPTRASAGGPDASGAGFCPVVATDECRRVEEDDGDQRSARPSMMASDNPRPPG